MRPRRTIRWSIARQISSLNTKSRAPLWLMSPSLTAKYPPLRNYFNYKVILFLIRDQYQGTSRKDEIMLQNHYLIKGALVKYLGKLKLYHTDYQMIVHDKYLEEIPAQEKKYSLYSSLKDPQYKTGNWLMFIKGISTLLTTPFSTKNSASSLWSLQMILSRPSLTKSSFKNSRKILVIIF